MTMERQDTFLEIDDDEDQRTEPAVDGEQSSHESEESSSSSGDSPIQSPRLSFTNSPQWPQSYRKSMDVFVFVLTGNSWMSVVCVDRKSMDGYSITASPNFGLISSSTSFPSKPPFASSFKRRSISPLFYDYGQEPTKTPLIPRKEYSEATYENSLLAKEGKDPEKIKSVANCVLNKVKSEGCSFAQAVFNGVNVLAGVGLLSTPYAIKEGGWFGLALLFLFAIICCYTGILLRRCLESQYDAMTYPDIGQAAFGKIGRFIISIVLYTELYAYCVEFLILEGDNLSRLFPHTHLSWLGLHMNSHKFFAVLTAIFVMPTVWLQDLRLLSYCSAGGVITTVLVVLMVIWIGAVDGVGFHKTGSLINLPNLPVSVGVYGFCYSGHAVFPNIYASMKNRAHFDRVLLVSFLLCTLFYGGVAVMGYLMFGQQTMSQITLNLPKQFLASKIAVWTTVINPFTKFALIITPIAMSLEELLPLRYVGPKNRWASTITVRTALVISTVCVAIMVPFFGYMMAFIGSVLSMLAAVILPCACYLSIFRRRANILQVALCVGIIAIGLICGIAGTYSSLKGIAGSL